MRSTLALFLTGAASLLLSSGNLGTQPDPHPEPANWQDSDRPDPLYLTQSNDFDPSPSTDSELTRSTNQLPCIQCGRRCCPSY
jgi:hypothetical protein